MNRAITILTLTLMATPALAAPKILVQDLGARGVEKHEAAVLATATCNALAKRAGYEVVCGDDLRAMIQWNTLAATFDACDDDTCVASTAKAMKARFVVWGSVAHVSDDFVLTLTMLDVEVGKPVGRAEVKADSVASLYKQVPEAVDDMLPKKKRK